MPVDLDFLKRIINVQWGGKQFLYSDAEGMWTSTDGQDWTQLDNSVPATSLAFVDGTWIAVSEADYDQVWRSTDNAGTWESISIASNMRATCAAAMKPKGTDGEGKPLPGVLAVLGIGTFGYRVYTSNDGGDTWSQAFQFANDQVEGLPGGHGLSGCGGALFVAAQQIQHKAISIPPFGDTHYIAYQNGMLYVSTDGMGFSGSMVWGPGDAGWDSVTGFWSMGYATGGVGYDDRAQQFCLTGFKFDRDGNNKLMQKTSNDPNFSTGDGAEIASDSQPLAGGFPIAGGSTEDDAPAEFATGYTIEQNPDAATPDFNIYAAFISGEKTLLKTVPNDFAGYAFSNVNFNNGTFAAVITATNLSQIYIASPSSSFSLAHSGTPIVWDKSVAAALAVGSVSAP